MKDTKHHLKNVQKKVVQSVKRENNPSAQPAQKGKNNSLKRPKTILNKRKFAQTPF